MNAADSLTYAFPDSCGPHGLTKREYFAGLAMPAIIISDVMVQLYALHNDGERRSTALSREEIAANSARIADALLAALAANAAPEPTISDEDDREARR